MLAVGGTRTIDPTSERMSENRYASKVGMIAHDETMVRMVETIANRIVTRSRGRRARPWAISRVTFLHLAILAIPRARSRLARDTDS